MFQVRLIFIYQTLTTKRVNLSMITRSREILSNCTLIDRYIEELYCMEKLYVILII